MPITDVMPTDQITPDQGFEAILKLSDIEDYDKLGATEARVHLKRIAKIAEKALQDLQRSRRGAD